MHSTLLIFLDGVGIGKDDPRSNPFFKYKFKTFLDIFGKIPHLENSYLTTGDKFIFPTDACLGVKELPQSGTGQTSIFCGVNAPKLIGRHFGPYPPSELTHILTEKNIFQEFLDRGMKVSFANAYPKIFFDYINSGRKRLSATSLSCLLTGVRLKNATDLRRGKALSAEIDNSRWVQKLDYNLPIIKPVTAAKRLLKMASENQFTLFEFFYTDHLGHGRIKDEMKYILRILDDFLFYILSNFDDDISLIICSDHGNLEDISIKTHTRNPALTITAGKNAKMLSEKIKRLDHIKYAILEMYN